MLIHGDIHKQCVSVDGLSAAGNELNARSEQEGRKEASLLACLHAYYTPIFASRTHFARASSEVTHSSDVVTLPSRLT